MTSVLRSVRFGSRRGGGLFFCSLLALALLGSPLAAFQLQPMSLEIEPAGEGAVGVFRLTNPGQEPVAVRVVLQTRSVGSSGEETNDPADHLFQVYPSQIILRPGAQQSVRVRWNGPTSMTQERAFRFVAEQVPVNLNRNTTEGSGVRFVLRYRAALYVAPPNVRPEVSIALGTVEPLPTEEEGEQSRFRITGTVRNTGTAHQLLDTAELVFSGDGWEQSIRMEEIEGLPGLNVLAGSTLPWTVEMDLPDRPTDVSLRGL